MKFTAGVTALIGAAHATEMVAPVSDTSAEYRIPSSYESAVMGRRILALSKLATLSTVFPGSQSSTNDDDSLGASWERRPSGLDGLPIGLMDYVADCEDEGNPTILAIKIATTFKNVRAGSNLTLSMRWKPPYPPAKRISFFSRLSVYLPDFLGGTSPYERSPEQDEMFSTPDTVPYSAANLPRFSLVGYLESIDPDPVAALKLATCFTSKHHDAKYWLPGNAIHEAEWARLIVTHVYWIGGFGDRAYIGWIPIEEWRNVTHQEWTDIKLPGEKKGWSEWAVDVADEL